MCRFFGAPYLRFALSVTIAAVTWGGSFCVVRASAAQLADNFDGPNGRPDGWTVINAPTEQYWVVFDGQFLTGNGDRLSENDGYSYAIVSAPGAMGWTDCVIAANVWMSQRNGAVGLVGRWNGPGDHIEAWIEFNEGRAEARLARVAAGLSGRPEHNVLAQGRSGGGLAIPDMSGGLSALDSHRIALRIEGSHASLLFDGATLLEAEFDGPAAGSVGLVNHRNFAYFDNVRVDRIVEEPVITPAPTPAPTPQIPVEAPQEAIPLATPAPSPTPAPTPDSAPVAAPTPGPTPGAPSAPTGGPILGPAPAESSISENLPGFDQVMENVRYEVRAGSNPRLNQMSARALLDQMQQQGFKDARLFDEGENTFSAGLAGLRADEMQELCWSLAEAYPEHVVAGRIEYTPSLTDRQTLSATELMRGLVPGAYFRIALERCPDRQTAETRLRSLEGRGLIGGSIEAHDEGFALYIGAYTTPEEAAQALEQWRQAGLLSAPGWVDHYLPPYNQRAMEALLQASTNPAPEGPMGPMSIEGGGIPHYFLDIGFGRGLTREEAVRVQARMREVGVNPGQLVDIQANRVRISYGILPRNEMLQCAWALQENGFAEYTIVNLRLKSGEDYDSDIVSNAEMMRQGDYRIGVARYETIQEARQLAQRLREINIAPLWLEPEGERFSVYAGRFSSSREAHQTADQWLRQGHIPRKGWADNLRR